MVEGYIHGYQEWEAERLRDQAGTLADRLQGDTHYEAGSSVLEAGCGVGAQTATLARGSPEAQITAVDISAASLTAARARVAGAGSVRFLQADILDLPFAANTFDHVFLCFVLEHLPRPGEALAALLAVLKPGGTLTVIDGDHGSVIMHPDSAAARRLVACQVELQRQAGGNALIGRELYPLLAWAGLCRVQVSPRMVYADASQPGLVDGFTRKTFNAMLTGVRERAIGAGLVDAAGFDEGAAALDRLAGPDGVLCYTFFKAVGEKPAS